MDGSLPVEGEQRRLGVHLCSAGAAGDVLADQCGDRWPVWDQAAVADLAAADDQQRASGVDVTKAHAACPAGTQAPPPHKAKRAWEAGPRAGPRGLSGSAAAASSSRRAWAGSNRNGMRAAVTR